MLTTTLTATQIVHGTTSTPHAHYWEPLHPALAVTPWEYERTDIHSVIGGQHSNGAYSFDCACGWHGPISSSVLDASAAIIAHALTTCAVCGGPKPERTADDRMDVFPRCSSCAI